MSGLTNWLDGVALTCNRTPLRSCEVWRKEVAGVGRLLVYSSISGPTEIGPNRCSSAAVGSQEASIGSQESPEKR